MLVLALVLAAGFVALSHWQLSRSLANATFIKTRDTETIRPLDHALRPDSALQDKNDRVMVRAAVTPVPGTLQLIADRHSSEGPVYWVVGAARVTEVGNTTVPRENTDGVLPVVYGRSSTAPNLTMLGKAIGTSARLIVGRLYGNEAPQPELDAGRLPNAVSVPALVNTWQLSDATPVYNGFVVLRAAPVDTLQSIPIPAPAKIVERNLLNVFYAAEWVFFAGFALFLWWRLAADDFKRLRERETLRAH